MDVRFWGVRGSVAVGGSAFARIGGNTSCVEVHSQGDRLILDAGTGLRALGEELVRSGAPIRATLLWSHLHWDHVQGFPFFTPAWLSTSRLALYGPGPDGDLALRRTLAQQMTPPTFPVPLPAMGAAMAFHAARHAEPFEVGPFRVTPFELPHPQGCLGYRVEADGQCFVYATDVELAGDRLSVRAAPYLEGADALCLDAQYTQAEYEGRSGPSRRGWGHSTVVEAAKLAARAGARRLMLFHHDPSRTDEQVENLAEEARAWFKATEPAREGKRILLAPSHASAVA